MAERRGIIGTTMALLLIAGALVSVSGCAQRSETSIDPGAARATEQTGSVAASTAAAADGAAGATATRAPSGTEAATGTAAVGDAAGGGAAPGLSAGDADALDAELSAIESELDRLSVPSDSDFDNIGEGLK